MKPYQHAQISAYRYGGTWQDYIRLHDFEDQTKAHFASMPHRMLFHSDFGLELAERILGATWHVASTGADIPTRAILTDHQIEDLGRVVPVADWLAELPATHLSLRAARALHDLRDNPAPACASRYGGSADDYAHLLAFFDSATPYFDSARRALPVLHNSLGIFLAETLFGTVLQTSAGNHVPVRSIGEDLVLARTGSIPAFGAIAARIPLRRWMCGTNVPTGLAQRHRTERAAHIAHTLDIAS